MRIKSLLVPFIQCAIGDADRRLAQFWANHLQFTFTFAAAILFLVCDDKNMHRLHEKDSVLAKEIDKDAGLKNTWNFSWLQEPVELKWREKEKERSVGDTISKINEAGKAVCSLCEDVIKYGSNLNLSNLLHFQPAGKQWSGIIAEQMRLQGVWNKPGVYHYDFSPCYGVFHGYHSCLKIRACLVQVISSYFPTVALEHRCILTKGLFWLQLV